MVSRGFQQRLTRYVVFTVAFFLAYAIWASLFDGDEYVLAALKALPFALAFVVLMDLLGIGSWIKRRKVTRAIPTILLVIAIAVILACGELWAAVPLIVLLAWIIGYVLKQRFSGREGGQTTPPRA
jgi:hypothetical protein